MLSRHPFPLFCDTYVQYLFMCQKFQTFINKQYILATAEKKVSVVREMLQHIRHWASIYHHFDLLHPSFPTYFWIHVIMRNRFNYTHYYCQNLMLDVIAFNRELLKDVVPFRTSFEALELIRSGHLPSTVVCECFYPE